jgi:hypothetical protein
VLIHCRQSSSIALFGSQAVGDEMDEGVVEQEMHETLY